MYVAGESYYTTQYIAKASRDYNREKIAVRDGRLRSGRLRLAGLSVVALCSIVVVLVISSLYRRKNAAYKALVQKAKEWARSEDSRKDAGGCARRAGEERHLEPVSAEDRHIMTMIDNEMIARQAYREAGLTAEMLADRIGVHRNSMSRAVNRVTCGNFNHYINSFRIKEAVRIMSDTGYDRISIAELYERVGFGNRTSFYRVFKQLTGLSLVEFQKNNQGMTTVDDLSDGS